jgi:hypothetical protein
MKWFVLASVLFISGCGIAIDGKDYQRNLPVLDPTTFFNGKVTGWGIVQDRSGNVIQQFKVKLDGAFDSQGQLVLDEVFEYQIGEGLKTRQWIITKEGSATSYKGQASDILGVATGETFGNALQWRYEMDLPVDGSTYRVTFDDWMWQFNDGSVINRSYIKKFGVVFAEVTIFFQKSGI